MRGLFVLSAIATVAAIGSASATSFTGSAVGSWGTPTGVSATDVYSISNNDAGGVASFDFGVGQGTPDNLFTFNGVGSDGGGGFTANPEQLFDIGHFTYYNGTTSNYPQLSGVSLGIALALNGIGNNAFTYNFSIDLTPNTTGNPVTDGDIVTIANGLTTTNFVSNGTLYTLALSGFSTDGGATITTQFLSPETSTATADIYATITSHVVPTPEPASLAVFAAGLLGLGFARRRFMR